MIAWLWKTGSAEGVTYDYQKARRTAASSMRSTRVGDHPGTGRAARQRWHGGTISDEKD